MEKYSECSKCIHKNVCDHWITAVFGTASIRPEEHCCEHYREDLEAQWKTRADKNDYLWVNCSNCGFLIENYKAVNLGISDTDVIGYKWCACPKCGAKMEYNKKDL